MGKVDNEPLLQATGVCKSYGGVRALIDSGLSCAKGEVHALLGENGAGKSTLVKILCGVVKPDAGTIRIKNRTVEIHSPTDANRLGIAAVFQELSLVPDLSVGENIYLGHEPLGRFGLIDYKKMRTMTEQLFEKLGLEIDPDLLVRDLSLARQQLVEIAKALAKDPEIIILDEATSALGNQEIELLFSLVKRLTREGKTIIFISHRMDELEQIADRATVFRDARYITTFEWGSVSNDQIVNWIAGRDLEESYPSKNNRNDQEIALEIHRLWSGRLLKNIDLQVRKGEILGLAGLQGHGQSEFLEALFGVQPITRGEIKIFGKPAEIKSPGSALAAGIAFVPEDRKTEGLLLTRTIRENLSLMTLDRRQVLSLIRSKAETEDCRKGVERLKIKTPHLEQAVDHLSGGNQQKVVIAKAILTNAKILLLANPTRGIDVGTKTEIYQLMHDLAAQGMTILFYSTELPELVGVCDRVAVFKQGEIAAILTGEAINENNIIQAALGIA